jgi:hypothetical protein
MRTEKPANSTAIGTISLSWNGEALATRAMRSGDEISVGDAEGSLARLPEEALGAAMLVVADGENGPHLRVPESKVAKVTGASGRVRLVAGPARVALGAGDEASLVLGAFEVIVAAHEDERVAKKGRRAVGGAWTHTAIVAAIHGALLFAGSHAAFASSIEAQDDHDVEAMRGYLAAAEERASAPDAVVSGIGKKTDGSAESTGQSGNGKKGGGERHEGEAGKAGSATSRAKGGHWGAQGQPARSAAAPEVDTVETARDFGMAGLLRAMNGGAVRPMAGDSPWGSADPFAARGGMLGRILGESEGTEGLALSGIGEGGGGDGLGLGLGQIGTIGHTFGLPGLGTGGAGVRPSAEGVGWGGSWGHIGRLGGRHKTKGPYCRCGVHTEVSGRLPPEAVQRIVRQNFGRFRACYEDGLKRNPGLAGRVATRFVIGRDGAVSSVSDGGSDLSDAAVRSCVQRAFRSISFPQPEGGIVTVNYPIVFSNVEST